MQLLLGRRVLQAQDVADDEIRIHPLELQVVDGEDGLDIKEARHLAILLAQEHRNQRRVPVVAVDDVREEIVQVQDQLQHRLGEEGHALAVVELAVDLVAVEVVLVVQKVVGDALHLEREQAAVLFAPAQRHLERGDKLHLL